MYMYTSLSPTFTIFNEFIRWWDLTPPLYVVGTRGHPFMTSTKTQAFDPLPLWTSTCGRHDLHTTLLKRLVQWPTGPKAEIRLYCGEIAFAGIVRVSYIMHLNWAFLQYFCVFKLIERLLTSGRALQLPLRCDLGSVSAGALTVQPNLLRWRLLTSGRALQSPLRCDLGSVSAGALTVQPNLARWRQSCLLWRRHGHARLWYTGAADLAPTDVSVVILAPACISRRARAWIWLVGPGPARGFGNGI